jgi:hypothetical protein
MIPISESQEFHEFIPFMLVRVIKAPSFSTPATAVL